MSQPDSNPPRSEDHTAHPDGVADADAAEQTRSLPEQDVPDVLEETKVEPVDDPEPGFSPSADTFSAIKDLGLRLQPAPSHDVIGRVAHYDIIRCLGRGGMGTVFEAFDNKLYRPVAIKFMASSLAASEKARSRFLREARVAASINHPNVVTIHAVDEYEGRPYLVMEFVAGLTLHEHVEKFGPLALSDILRISRQIATGLRPAHENGIVHRDIKPGNILLENGVQRVKIVDFGLAQVVFELSDITSLGQTLGTPKYMSPEQIEGSRVDERADLFSLGCVMYMMCAGRPPFPGNSITVLNTILRDPHIPVCEVAPRIPQELSDLIDSLLCKSREERLQSAALVEAAITDIARGRTPSDESVRALPPTVQQSAVPTHRNLSKTTAVSACVAAAALIGWAVWSSDGEPNQTSRMATQQTETSKTADQVTEVPSREPTTLTVGGLDCDFPSLQAAMSQIREGDTLLVHGMLPSDDVLLLNNPTRHANLTVAWQSDTVYEYAGNAPAVITIDSVPGVRIQGAQIRAFNAHLLSVRGDCTGLVVEDCRLQQAPESHQSAIVFWETAKGSPGAPIQLNRCEIHFFELGIACVGASGSAVEQIHFKQNVIRGLQPEWGTALTMENSVHDVHVLHNRITSVRRGISGVGAWQRVVVSNNTFFNVMECIGSVEGAQPQSVQILGNLAIQCDTFATGISPAVGGTEFAFNKSDLPVEDLNLAATMETPVFVSTEVGHADFMRPASNQQLKIPQAPHYAGALEPRPADGGSDEK